ncbi:hypothetical protein B0H67DRAFT_581007 [Lasiosphaeris hirsuta]|uniref:Uncharacterized protein n=1 Tax=Lasiosphaeris hirsuta TaxID=260670 RepID=A0AA40DVZ8_9PEZI|nr:hypothetical protein B0H67DRAFT_581007 [Lasiosphaeris hirsuta]
MQVFDQETGGWELGTVLRVEKETGFGPHVAGQDPLAFVKRFDIDPLNRYMQAVSEVGANINNRTRHQRISLSLIKMIISEERTRSEDLRVDESLHGLSGQALAKCHKCLKTISKVVMCLEQHITTYIEYIGYLKDRSERLSGVLLALLTHEDAAASIGFAAASVELAAAAKRDGSSMKTIAVMTMVFLLANFPAALFAVPFLKWDWGSGKTVQDNFWVYWAFVLPTTAAVLLVWVSITCRAWIREKAAEVFKFQIARCNFVRL